MSGARGTARDGKRKWLVRVKRLDRSNRKFDTYVFVSSPAILADIEIKVYGKYDFPVEIIKVQWA